MMNYVVSIQNPCEHGYVNPHVMGNGIGRTYVSVDCPGGSSRVLDPADYAETWRCVSHGGDFTEQDPDKYSMCLWLLHEDRWNALPAPDPCEPRLVVILQATVGGE